jgi:protocatechuate 3,4-dioxygenase beta subunit
MKIAVLCTVFLMATTPITARAQPVPVTITGRVVVDDTGEPIANVRVAAPSSANFGTPVTLTDVEGRFTLTIAEDAAQIIASKTGFGRREATRAAGSQTIEIRLWRGAAISGRVVDEVGEPVQGARVSVQRVGVTNAPAAAVSETDDRGEYRIASLAADAYLVSAFTSGPSRRVQTGPAQFVTMPAQQRTFYPGVAERDEAQPIRLEPGDDRQGVDFVTAGARSVSPQFGRFQDGPGTRPPAPRAGATATGIIRGHVTATDGRSLPNALVRLFLESDLRQAIGSRADRDGAFEFRDLPAGTYRLLAAKTGFGPVATNGAKADTTRMLGAPTVAVTLAADETRERVDIPLERWGSIVGRVLDERGEPLQSANVQIMQVRYEAGRRRLTPTAAARTTDDLGRYRVFNVPPGQYIVSAAIGDVQSADFPGYARSFYPNGSNPAQAQFVSVGLSQDLSAIDLLMARTRTARISGKMRDSAGQPTMGGSLMLVPSQRSASVINVTMNARILPDGQFEFVNVPPGQYVIQSYLGRNQQWIEGEFGSIPVSVDGADVADLVLQTSSGSNIHGHFTFDAQDPSKQPARGRIDLVPTPVDFDLAPPSVATAEIHDDWSFDIAGVNGPRRLQVTRAPAGWALENVLVNGVSVTDRPLAFGRDEQSLGDVEVVLTDRPSEIAGAVRDDRNQPLPGAHVIVFSTDRDNWYPASRFLREAMAATDGAYAISGLPFGAYYVVTIGALPNEGADAWQDPAYLATLARRASSVTIRDGQKQSLDLRMSSR